MNNETSNSLKNEQSNEEDPQMLNHNGDNQASNHLDKIKPDYKDSLDDTTTEEIEKSELDKDNSKTDKMKNPETLDGGNMGNMISTLLGGNNEKNKAPEDINEDNQGILNEKNKTPNVLINRPSEDDGEINHTSGNLEDESEQKNEEAPVDEEMNQIQDSTSTSSLKDDESSQVFNQNEDNQVLKLDDTSKQMNSKSEDKPKDTTSQKESESKESKKSYVLPCIVGSCTALAIAYFMRIQFPSPHVTVAVFIGIALVGALVAYSVAKLFDDNDDKMQTKLEEPSISQDKVHAQGCNSLK